MSQVALRPLGDGDVDTLVGIWNRALRRDPIDGGRFVAWLLGDPDFWPGDDSGLFVAERDGGPVGFVRAIIRRWPNDRVGLEPECGWIPVLAVDPAHQRHGLGRALFNHALDWLRRAGRRRVWLCGNSGSAPGYVFPGVDTDAYAGALQLCLAAGCVVDHDAVAMAREVVDFDVAGYRAEAWGRGQDIVAEPLTPPRVQSFLTFLADAFPGDWNMAARAKLRAGRLHEVLIARRGDVVLGYCQWEGEHFGPFGVTADARRERIGAKLFVEAVQRIRAADGRTVWFNWADPDAARFYERFGLRPTRHFAILRRDL